MLLDGRARPTGVRRKGGDATLLLILNAHDDVVNFHLPEVTQGVHWRCLLDTHRPKLREGEEHDLGSEFLVTNRSVLLFELHKEDAD